jgi:two-component system cell cycle response regulator DivK
LLTFLPESENFEVIQSNNGIDGIIKTKYHKPYAIILDVQLPDMNGYEVARVLKFNEKMRKIPIIVVTSFAMQCDRNKALIAGANGYIEKPIDPDTFISQIEAFIPSLCSDK